MDRAYIISISFMVEPEVHDEWYQFFTTKFLPYLKESGFEKQLFTRVLTNDANPHYTYSLQMPDSEVIDHQNFEKIALAEYNKIAQPWFGEKVLYYISLLKKIKI